jgi:hypothetical protein
MAVDNWANRLDGQGSTTRNLHALRFMEAWRIWFCAKPTVRLVHRMQDRHWRKE